MPTIPPNQETFIQPFVEPILGKWLYVDSYWWTAIGLLAGFIFSSRFIVQWLQSEKTKKLVVPTNFWYLSFYGSVLNLLYALHLDKLPLIATTFFLPILYGRNLILLKRGQRQSAEKAE